MKMIDGVKKVTTIVVSLGVGAIVSNIVKSTTPGSVRLVNKVCIGIGAFILSSMISDQATKYTEQKIDETVIEIKNMVKNEEI